MSVSRINHSIHHIDPNSKNQTGNIYINILKNEFIMLNKEIIIPKIPVSHLSYDDAFPIVQTIIPFIPLFLLHHTLLNERNPQHELHSLHFATLLEGTLINFYHVLRIDFKFGGDSSTIIEPGNNDYYPSYRTSRLYYKSRLVPTLKIPSPPITPIKLIQSITTESDQYFHTYAMFDDIDTSHITNKFITMLPDIFSIPAHLYPFIVMDYYTACMNIPNPLPEELTTAITIFEPLFLVIASRCIPIESIIQIKDVIQSFPELLEIKDQEFIPTNNLIHIAKEYFGRYSLSRDEQCMVKGWWQIGIK
ncbi:MAG: hypothetical protein N3F66_07215 [Spirochaetes bacterium]|nr:hypothetical protein [Spirochaetota bacterium]